MRIQNNFTPMFGAKFVNSIEIGKLSDESKTYSDENVSFVEIEPDNYFDVAALEKCSKYWSDAKFADNIHCAAQDMSEKIGIYDNNKIYVLTLQKDSFEKLDDRKILGLMHTNFLEPNFAFIERLQANSNIIYSRYPEYKGIGTGILNSLKRFCTKISLFPTSDKSVKDFYERNGFVEYSPGSNLFVWVKDVFERF